MILIRVYRRGLGVVIRRYYLIHLLSVKLKIAESDGIYFIRELGWEAEIIGALIVFMEIFKAAY